MLNLPQKTLDYLGQGWSQLATIVGVVTSFLGDEQSSQTDWNSGTQIGTPGVDFPATTLTVQLLVGGGTATVVSSSGFSIGSAGDPRYIIFYDGVNPSEIVSYTGSTGTTFTGLVRGLYGTTARQWEVGDNVFQLVISHGESPDYNLEIQPKNWTQRDVAGGPPVARMGHGMVHYPTDGCFYVFGGYDGAVYLQDLWKFDPATDTWSDITPGGAKPPIRAYHGMTLQWHTTYDDCIAVYGGMNGGGSLNDAWVYDISAGAWFQVDNGPGPRHSMMAFHYLTELDRYFMIFTGGVVAAGLGAVTTWILGGDGSWTRKADAPYSTWQMGAACWMDQQGVGLVVAATLSNHMVAACYDLALNLWSVVTPPPARRWYPALAYDDVNNIALLFGGDTVFAGGNAVGTLYSYQKETNAWSTHDTYSRGGRARHAADWDITNEQMFVWGGVRQGGFPTWPTYVAPLRFRYYWEEAQFRTQNMDLGSVPTENGIWILEDIYDTVGGRTGVSYDADYSDNAVAWFGLGIVEDGDEITELHRHWRVDVTLTNDGGLDVTPAVQKIDANFDVVQYFSMASRPVGDYPPIVSKISSLSSKVDTLKATAEIGAVTIDFLNNSLQAQKLITEAFPRNNTLYVKIGFLEDDFSVSDFILALKCRIDDWDVNPKTIKVKTRDFLGDLKKEIPEEDLGGGVAALVYNNGGIASHPVDIMTDIIQNQVNIPNRDIDLVSFDVVRAEASMSAWEFNRTVSSPEDAYGLCQELCRHIGAVLIPREDGRIALKLLNAAFPPVDTWDERTMNFKNVQFKGRGAFIKNYISTWWHWDGDGDEYSDYEGIEVSANADSITNWGRKVFRTKSKWLGDNIAPYIGDILASDISDRILALAKNGVQAITLETNMNAYPVQVGDLIRIRSSVVSSFEEYRKWQQEQGNERPRPQLEFMNDCELANWTESGQASPETLNPTMFMRLANSLNIGKTGVAGIWAAYALYNITPLFDGTGKNFHPWVFITDVLELRVPLAIQIRVGNDAANYYKIEYTRAELADGLNKLGGALPDDFIVVGAPDITALDYLFLSINTTNNGDTIAHGNIRMDMFHLVDSDWDFVTKTGRYSIPYMVYGAFESIDMKWWVTKKQIDFTKGTIKWELHRAREAPLIQQFTSQVDFYSGTGIQIDIETTPGSVQLALENGTYFVTGTYEIIMDMDQQPEQDGAWTLSITNPVGTAIKFEAWASETGHFSGEETYLYPIIDGDAITIKTRWYKVKATLYANGVKDATPRVDEITATFTNG